MRFQKFILKKWLKVKLNKNLALFFWKRYIFIKLLFNYFSKISKHKPQLFYGGAIKGNRGGPSVKVKKLNLFFPEKTWHFNIMYLLSNSIYLTPSSINLLKRKKVPIVLNQNGVFYPEWYKGDWEKQNSKMSEIYHLADYVLWQSEFCKNASEKFLGRRSGSGEILYNAVDTALFKPRKESNEKRFTFLITGNIQTQSNYRILNVIYALKEIIKENKNIFLKVAGYIQDREAIISKVHQLNLENHITLLKNYTQEDAPELYKKADAYITIAYQDNCPSAVLEAMSSGLPILYSSSGGIPELVDKDSGIGLKVSKNWEKTQVPRTDDIQIGMNKIIENKKMMSEASRIRALEKFDLKNWITKHELVFEKLLDKY